MTPHNLGRLSRYAFVERATLLHSKPSARGKPLGWIHTITFWGTSTVLPVLQQTVGRDSWTRVRLPSNSLPGSPADQTAWVPTSALSPTLTVHTRLQIDREHFTATLIRDGHTVFTAPVGVGQPQWPTPTGQFYVEESITPAEPDGIYGSFAFGTSAHSKVLTGWPNEGQIGIHGTNEPWLIPGRISHGCIRLRNSDIQRLAELMQVGTPVTIK